MKTNDLLKKICSGMTAFIFFFSNTCYLAYAQQIVTDGRTNTHLHVNGSITDVHAHTQSGSNAFNSFSSFDVYQGNTVNLHLENGVQNLLNLVHDRRSDINGILNSIQNGQIGGNVFFLNPHGMVVGKTGVINVGSLTALTPTKEFLENLISPTGTISNLAVQSVLDGNTPLNPNGLISIKGTINAKQDIDIQAGDIIHDGLITTGAQFKHERPDFSDVVNVKGLNAGAQLSFENGDIRIVALNDIQLNDGSVITAKGVGADSDGGTVNIWADNNTYLEKDALIDVSGGDISGDGGFIELSADKYVKLEGALAASAIDGEAGFILIDPDELDINTNRIGSGANWTFEADQKITVFDNITISSRNIGSSTDYLNALSIGDSGSISFKAPEIIVGNNVLITAEANAGFTGGDVTFEAKDIAISTPIITIANTKTTIEIGSATIRGRDVTLLSDANSAKFFEDGSLAAETTLDFLTNASTFAALAISNSEAKINIKNGANISASNIFKAEAKATSDASMTAIGVISNIAKGKTKTDAGVTVETGAKIHADSDVTITTDTDTKVHMAAFSVNLGNGRGSRQNIAVAVTSADIDAKTDVQSGATITSGQNIDIQTTSKKDMNTTALAGSYEDGTVGISVAHSTSDVNTETLIAGTLTAEGNITTVSTVNVPKNDVAATSAAGSAFVAKKIIKGANGLINKVKDWMPLAGPNPRARSGSSKYALSAAVSYADHINRATTTIQGVLKAKGTTAVEDGNIRMASSITDVVENSAIASVDSQATAKIENAFAGAVTIGKFDNQATTTLGNTAQTNAKRETLIESIVLMPYEIQWHQINDVSDIVDKINPNLGIQNGFFTTWAQSIASTEKVGVAGSGVFANFDTQSIVLVDEGAQINQDVSLQSNLQDLTVKAKSEIDTLNISGVFGLKGLGVGGGKGGVGASYLDITYNTILKAEIEKAAKINAERLRVQALSTQKNISIAEAGGKAGKYGASGSFNYLDVNNNVLARIDEGAQITTGTALWDATTDNVIVEANDDVQLYNIAGGITKGQAVGVGISIGINDIDRTTKAIIGHDVEDTTTAADNTNGALNFGGQTRIDANQEGSISSWSIAGALAGGSNSSASSENSQGGAGKFGLGFSGASSWNDINDTAQAYINGAKFENLNTSLFIQAKNESAIDSVSGAAAVTLASQGASTGLSGSLSRNIIGNTTEAFVKDSIISVDTTKNSLILKAENKADIDAIAAGGAVAHNPQGKGFAIAGSVAINKTNNNTTSYIDNSKISSQLVDLNTTDESSLFAVAGTVAYGSKAGFGASFAYNEINNQTQTYSLNSNIFGAAGVLLNAKTLDDIFVVGAAIGASKEFMAAAAAVTVNQINNETESYISGTKDGEGARADDEVLVKAEDDSRIRAYAGDAGGSTKGAIGISGSYNAIENKTKAYVTNTKVTSNNNNVTVESISDTWIETVAVGAQASGKIAVAGSAAGNKIKNETFAYINNSNVRADDNIYVHADSKNEVDFYGGRLTIAKNGGVGGSAAINIIKNQTKAYVAGTSILLAKGKDVHSISKGDGTGEETDFRGVGVVADSQEDVDVWTANVSGAGEVAFAGTASYSEIEHTTEAYIDNSTVNQDLTDVNGGQDVVIRAFNYSDVDVKAGAVAVGVKGGGLGFTLDMTKIKNNTRASIRNTANVKAKNDVGVQAISEEYINSIVISGGAGKVAGLAGSVPILKSEVTTEAYVADATLKADNDISVTAKDTVKVGRSKAGSDTGVIAGALGVGLGGGVAGSVLVTKIDNETTARVTNATMDAKNATNVLADAVQDIYAYVVTGALGKYVGAAGSIAVNSIKTLTQAYIDGTSLINSDENFASDNQDVNVTATNNAKISGNVGGGSAGALGLGASVDVASINNTTLAALKAGSNVKAKRDIKVNADSDKAIDSFVVNAGGGILSVRGSVSVAKIGSNLSEDAADATTSSGTTANDQGNVSSVLDSSNFGRDGLFNDITGETSGENVNVNDEFDRTQNANTNTLAYIGSGATVSSGRDIDVKAEDFNEIDILSGSADIGIGSIGGGVAIANVGGDNKAYVGVGANLSAGNNITVDAKSGTRDSKIVGYAGQLGGVALGAAYASFETSGNTEAFVSGSNIQKANDVSVNALSDNIVDVEAHGYRASGIGSAGASIAKIKQTGITQTYLGNNTTIGQWGKDSVNNLSLGAQRLFDYESDAFAGSFGTAFSGVGADALVEVNDNIYSFIGDSSNIDVLNDVSLRALADGNGDAGTFGINVGTLAVGVSKSKVYISPVVRSYLGKIVSVDADDLLIYASQDDGDGTSASSDAFAAAGFLFGGDSTQAESKNDGEVYSYVDDNSTLNIGSSTQIKSNNESGQRSNASSYHGGVVAVGANKSTSTSTTTTESYLGSGVRVTGGNLTIEAKGDDVNFAETKAGKGGLISGSAAISKSTTNATVKSYIKDGIADRNIDVNNFIMEAQFDGDFNAKADSVNASVVGSSGAYADNSVNTTVETNVYQNNNVTATDMKLSARMNLRKSAIGNNVKSGSGGAVDVPAAKSTTTMTNNTKVIVGNNARLKVALPQTENSINATQTQQPGNLVLSATNNLYARDKVNLVSGGAILVANTDSELKNDTNNALVEINAGARLDSEGNIILAAKSDVDFKTEAYTKTYGLAGSGQADALSRTNINNTISLKNGSVIRGEKNVNIYAGRNENGTANVVRLTAKSKVYNKTLIPIHSDPTAKAQISQSNVIDVQAGADVGAFNDVTLFATKGSSSADGSWKSTDLWKEIAGFFSKLFGGDGSTEATGGSSINNASSMVKVDGRVKAGIYNKQRLIIGSNGDVLLQDEGVFFKLTKENLSENIINEIERYEDLKNEYAELSDTRLAYENEIERLKRSLAELNQLEDDNVAQIQDVDFITVDDLWAQSGDLFVQADSLIGSGDLEAPGDTLISIINHSPNYLRTNKLTIPDDDTGGRILFNNRLVRNRNDITVRNSGRAVANFQSVITSGNTNEPLIHVENTYNPDAPQNVSKPNPAPTIEMIGNVSNLDGTVSVKNKAGSVHVKANINANTIDIEAGKDFVLSYTDSFFHAGGDPKAHWESVSDASASSKKDRTVNGVRNAGGKSNIIAGNNVFLSARYLNINGLVQSGVPDQILTIPENIQIVDELGNLQTLAWAHSDYLTKRFINQNPEASPFYRVKIDGNIETFYNVELARIELEGVRVQGGRMELFGHILNTGGSAGKLKVIDGYGRINIDNQSAFDVVLNRLDTGKGIEGILRITDLGKRTVDDRPLETIYTHIGNDIQITDSTTRDAGGAPSFLVNTISGRNTQYNPLANQRYVWVEGQNFIDRVVREYGGFSFWGGQKIISFGTSGYRFSSTTPLNGQPLLEGDYLAFDQTNSAEYAYDFINRTLNGYRKTGDQSWSTNVFLSIVKAYFRKVTFERGRKEVHINSIKADHPIGVEFSGYDVGQIDITSKGSLLINGLFKNKSGLTNVTTAGAINQLSANAVVEGKNINLTAQTGVGNESAVRTDVLGGLLSATTEAGNIALFEVDGDLTFDQITTNAGDVHVRSDRGIINSTPTALIQGNFISLDAGDGTIGLQGQKLMLNTGTDTKSGFQAIATDSIFVQEQSGDLQIVKVHSESGDVEIDVLTGGLFDINTNEERDLETENELVATWDELGLRVEDGAVQQANDQVDAFERRKENEYQTYWGYRSRQADPSVYDPTFQVVLSADEQQALKNNQGWSDTQVTSYEQNQTQLYHSLHSDYGENTFDANFKYVATQTERDAITDGSVWTEDELRYKLPTELFAEVTDTETRIEDANIIAKNVKLNIVKGLGRDKGLEVIDLNDGESLTLQQKILMTAAELDDLTLDEEKGLLTVQNREDVDVHASESITIDATENIFLGGEEDLNIDHVNAGDAIRLKGGKGIFNVATTPKTNVTGGDLILEAADNSIGQAGNPLTIDLQEGARFTARAGDNIFVEELTGSLNLNTIFALNTVNLKAAQGIFDDNNTGVDNIRSKILFLDAPNIGASDNLIEFTTGADGFLNVNALNDVYLNHTAPQLNINSVITGGLVNFLLLGSLDDFGTNTELDIQGNEIRLTSLTGYIGQLENAIELSSNLLTVTALDDIVLDEIVTDANINEIRSLTGDVVLSSESSILDANNNGEANILANNIDLLARNGSIGDSANSLDIDSAFSDDGLLEAKAQQSIYLNEVDGDLTVKDSSIESFTENIDLIVDGSILDNDITDQNINIKGDTINIRTIKGAIGDSENQNRLVFDSQTNLNLLAKTGIFIEERLGNIVSDFILVEDSGPLDLLLSNGHVIAQQLFSSGSVNIDLIGDNNVWIGNQDVEFSGHVAYSTDSSLQALGVKPVIGSALNNLNNSITSLLGITPINTPTALIQTQGFMMATPAFFYHELNEIADSEVYEFIDEKLEEKERE